jgi:pimeloyl-ACP methyl ester carboxylesterase
MGEQKKTIARQADQMGLIAMRTGLQVLGRVSPNLAAQVVLRMAFRVKAYPRPGWEQKLLDEADDHFLLPFMDGHLCAWSWGSGPTVLLAHGWEGRGTQLGRFIRPLVEEGFRVVTFDGPGHGLSTVSRASLPDHARALGRLGQHLGSIHTVIAHSMGAAATTYAATQGLLAQRYVLIAPPIDPLDFFEMVAVQLGLNRQVQKRILRKTEQVLEVGMAELYAPRMAKKLDAPVLIIHDHDDKEVPIEKAQLLADAWPDSAFVATEGLGHRRILKNAEVISAVTAFIQEQSRNQAA